MRAGVNTVAEASDGGGKAQEPREDIELSIQAAEHSRQLAGQHFRLQRVHHRRSRRQRADRWRRRRVHAALARLNGMAASHRRRRQRRGSVTRDFHLHVT